MKPVPGALSVQVLRGVKTVKVLFCRKILFVGITKFPSDTIEAMNALDVDGIPMTCDGVSQSADFCVFYFIIFHVSFQFCFLVVAVMNFSTKEASFVILNLIYLNLILIYLILCIAT